MNIKIFLLMTSIVLLHEVNGATLVSKPVAKDLANETVATSEPEDMEDSPEMTDNLVSRSSNIQDTNHQDEPTHGDVVKPGYGGSDGGKPGYGGNDGGKPGYGGNDGGKPGYGGNDGGKPGYGGNDGGKPGYGGNDGGKPGYGGSVGGEPGYGGNEGGKPGYGGNGGGKPGYGGSDESEPGYGGSDGGTTAIKPRYGFEITEKYKFGQDASTDGTAQPDYEALSQALMSGVIEIDLVDLSIEDQIALLWAITQLGAAQQQTQNPAQNALIHQSQQQTQQQQQGATGQTGSAIWPGVTYPAQANPVGQSPFNIGRQSQHAHHGGHADGIHGQNMEVQGGQGISIQGVPGIMNQGGEGLNIGGQVVGIPGQGAGIPVQGLGSQGQGVGIQDQGMGIQGQGLGIQGQGVGIQGQGVGIQGQGLGIQGQGVGIQGQGVGIGSQQDQQSVYPSGLPGYQPLNEQGVLPAGQPVLSAVTGNSVVELIIRCIEEGNMCQEGVAIPSPCDSILEVIGLETCTQPNPLTGKGIFGRSFHYLKTGVGSIFNYAKTGAQTVVNWFW